MRSCSGRRPGARANARCRRSDDFRVRLAQLKVGQALYEVVARERALRTGTWGSWFLTAPVVSSHYGDEALYFQHNMARD